MRLGWILELVVKVFRGRATHSRLGEESGAHGSEKLHKRRVVIQVDREAGVGTRTKAVPKVKHVCGTL